jgi:hypothetical protein
MCSLAFTIVCVCVCAVCSISCRAHTSVTNCEVLYKSRSEFLLHPIDIMVHPAEVFAYCVNGVFCNYILMPNIVIDGYRVLFGIKCCILFDIFCMFALLTNKSGAKLCPLGAKTPLLVFLLFISMYLLLK